HLEGPRHRRRHEALELRRHACEPRNQEEAPAPWLDRAAQERLARLEGQEDGRSLRRRARDDDRTRDRRGPPRGQPPHRQGRGPGPQRRARRGSRLEEEGELMAVTVPVIGSDRQVTLDLPEPKESVLHEVVAWQLAKRRRGTAATKTRGQVAGSTAKIWPQKGTGRARHGSRKAPIFVGGGTAFGPQPRDYGYTLPKRVRRLGLQMAIASRAQSGKLTLVDSFGIQGKTREFVAWAKQNGIDGSERVLLVTDDELARRAARNLPWVDVLPGAGLNAYDVLRADRLVADAALFEGEAVR